MHRYDHCHKYKHVDVNTFVNHAGTKKQIETKYDSNVSYSSTYSVVAIGLIFYIT